MSIKSVIVHSCFAAIEPLSIGSGPLTSRRIFHVNLNSGCACHKRKRISFNERDRLLAEGSAFVIVEKSGSAAGCFLPEWLQVVLVHKQKGPPWWRPLKQWDVDAAIMGSRFQTERIETYGRLVEAVRLKLLRPAPEGVHGWS